MTDLIQKTGLKPQDLHSVFLLIPYHKTVLTKTIDEFFFQLGGGGYRNFYDNNMMNAYDQLNNVKNDASNPFRFIK